MLSALWKKKEPLSLMDSFIFETSPEVILFLDARGRIERVNEQVHKWLGYKTKSLIGKSIFDLSFITPESKEIIKKNFFKRLKGEKVAPYEIKCFTKNGQIEVGRVTAKLMKKGKIPVGSLIMISNVTRLEVELEKNLEEARHSEIRYKGLFDNIRSAAVVCDYVPEKKDFIIKEVNKYFIKTEKFNKKDVIGKKLSTVLYCVKTSASCKDFVRPWKDNTSVQFKFTIKKDGQESLKEGNAYRLPTDELMVIYDDVTKLEEASEQIKENERKFRHIFESANDSIFLMDGNNFIDCNKKTLSIYGCSKRSDIIGKTPLDFSPLKQPDGMSSQRKALKYIRSAINGKPQKFYWKHSKKNGELFDAEVSLNRVTISSKVFIQAVVRDITKEIEVLTRLEESEESLRLAQEVSAIGHWDWNIISGEVKWSKGMADILEFNNKFILTRESFLKLVHPEDRKNVGETIARSVKTGQEYKVDHRIITPGGKEKTIHAQGKVVRNGKSHRMIGLLRDITKEKNLLDKLENSEFNLRRAQSVAQTGHWVWNIHTGGLEWSEEVKNIFEVKKSFNPSYKKFLGMVHKEDRSNVKNFVEESLKTGSYKIDHRIITGRGKEKIVHEQGDVTYNKKGEPIRMIGVVRDITSAKLAEEKIGKNEARLQSLFENNRDALFIADAKTRKLVDVNLRAIQLMGYSKGKLLTMSADDLHPQDLVKETMVGFKRQAEGKQDLVETEVLTKNKKRIPVSISISSYEGEDGENYVQGSFRDVSIRRKAELELQDSEQKLRTIVTNAQAIIFIIGKDGKFILSEGEKLAVLGLKPGQVIGADAFEMYKDSPVITKGIEDAFSGKTTRTIAKVGEIYFDIFYSPYKDSHGKIIGMIGMAIDVTQSELAKTKLIEIDKSKSEFISMASHQLRTPLGNIRWELEGLLRNGDIKDNKQLEKSLKVVYKHDLRLIDLVNNLLNISRIENQRVMDKPERSNIISVIKEILEESRDQVVEKKLEVHFHEAEKIMITYDKKLIREVLSNLIINAIKFNKRGGIVVIKADKSNGEFSFKVANTGSLISKSDQKHIFEKFYRGSKTEGNISGTGLGLHITKSYIEKWHGEISFESPANFSERSMNGQKYQGTIFSVKLPVSAK